MHAEDSADLLDLKWRRFWGVDDLGEDEYEAWLTAEWEGQALTGEFFSEFIVGHTNPFNDWD